MYTAGTDTKTTTLIQFIGPVTAKHQNYAAAYIYFAEDFDHKALPKSCRAHRMMSINCTPRADNAKNEAGIKRLNRILKALEGTPVKFQMHAGNAITREEFFSRYA